MSMIQIILITIFIPLVQLARPTIRLTFTPDEKYFPRQQQVEIHCELLNPTQRTDSAQLWHVDLKTGKRTSISRSLLTSPTEDAPDIFKTNRNKRYEFLHRNHIRIRGLQMEDSAKYECDCPDCEQIVTKQTRDLHVMKLVEPKWIIESVWPLHENSKSIIKCQVDDFYPYIQHKILRDHHEITNDGKSTLTNNNVFPQKFLWETTITPTADWHGSTLRCSVTEGNTEQHATQILDILFDPRFLKCEERQYVDLKQDKSSIECSYSGNPQPKLLWLRKSDRKPVTSDVGITIDVKNETHGKYKSIVKFDRNKIISNPIQPSSNISGETYYQQLLNNGFIVQLTLNGNEKGSKTITIVRDANEIRSKVLNNSIVRSSSLILCTFLLIILHIILR